MYNGNTISLKQILWRVYEHPVADGLNYEDAAEYAISGLRLVGAPLVYIEDTCEKDIINYKAGLPENMISIRGVKLLNAGGETIALRKATDLYHVDIARKNTGPSINNNSGLPTSPYDNTNQGVNSNILRVNSETESDGGRLKEFTYIAQNGVIQTSFREGTVVISFYGIGCDDDGYPLIPDNEQVKLCLEYYILFRFLEPLFIAGKITDKAFNYINQKKSFYMGAANTSMQLQGIDHLESTMNAINRLIINDKAFDNFYMGAGAKERIKRYN